MDFKDLEPLLQQCYDNKNMKILDYTITKLLPAGENYGSIMVKIDAKIRQSETAKEEMLYLVGKTPSCSEMVNWPLIFVKERFMYEKLFPVYKELEKEAGIAEGDLINVLPNFIGSRNSLLNNVEADEDSVLLMENLKIKGFYIANKQPGVFYSLSIIKKYLIVLSEAHNLFAIVNGMDVHHARTTLTALAKYHALGIVMKQQRPTFAQKAIEQARTIDVDFSHLNTAYLGAYEIFKESPNSKKHLAVIQSSLEQMKDEGNYKAEPVEPWATIIHGDFWTNNMLFHKDEEGNVDDVKLVDFQTYLYSSPLFDVCLFLGSSLDVETQNNYLEELLNLYYDVFIQTLKRMDYDTSPFTKVSFDCEVKKQAIAEFLHGVLAHKFFTSEIIDDNKSNEENVINIVNDKPSDAFIDRIMWLVQVYERMQWF